MDHHTLFGQTTDCREDGVTTARTYLSFETMQASHRGVLGLLQ